MTDTDRMAVQPSWSQRAQSLREQLPRDVVEAIDSTAAEVPVEAELSAVIAALRARGVGFIGCIAGLIALRDVPLGEAKWLVHQSEAYADDREEREASWAAMYDEVSSMPEVQQERTAARPAEPTNNGPPQPA